MIRNAKAALWRNCCRWSAAAVLLLSAACGQGGGDVSPPPGLDTAEDVASAVSATLPEAELDSPREFYRVDLLRAASGAIAVSRVARVELERYPMPSLAGDHVMVAYSGDDVRAATRVQFPSTAIGLERGSEETLHVEIAVPDSVATAFVSGDADVDRIVLLGANGSVVAELSENELAVPEIEKSRLPPRAGDDIGQLAQPISTEQLAFRYAHIRFLAPGQEGELAMKLLQGSSIIAPTDAMNDVIADGLAKLAPALLGSVQKIGVVRWPAGDPKATSYLGFALGANLILNADLMNNSEMVLTVVHEIVHNFTFLSGAAATSDAQALGEWPNQVQKAAQAVVKRFRLTRGLTHAWERLHASGLPGGDTAPYTGTPNNTWKTLTDVDARTQGFATPYGSTSAVEDIAEYAATLQVPMPTLPGICPAFAGGGAVTENLAIPYAKLILLLGVGAITESAFGTCVQGASIPHQPGIHLSKSSAFASELRAGVLTNAAGSSYGILGTGRDSFQLLVKVALESPDESALGLHRLDNIWFANANTPGLNEVLLGNGETFSARAGAEGLVLFTDARPERTAGAIFGLVLQNAVGQDIDFFPYGTFQIP